jgi:hypothetical protein
LGSAMISNTDSTLLAYSTEHILVKVYNGEGHQPPRPIPNNQSLIAVQRVS